MWFCGYCNIDSFGSLVFWFWGFAVGCGGFVGDGFGFRFCWVWVCFAECDFGFWCVFGAVSAIVSGLDVVAFAVDLVAGFNGWWVIWFWCALLGFWFWVLVVLRW